MVVQNLRDFKKKMDGNFGTPGEALKNIKELSDNLASIDQKKIKELKSIMGAMGNVKIEMEQLRLIVEIVRMLCTVDIEKVREFRQLTLNLIQLTELLPNMKDMPIGEVLHQLKQS